jgi:hypothetical protein
MDLLVATLRPEVEVSRASQMNRAVIEYYRCPDSFVDFRGTRASGSGTGFFMFGGDAVCYGELSAGVTVSRVDENMYDAIKDVRIEGVSCYLPFDPSSVIDNLRGERYMDRFAKDLIRMRPVRSLYYFLRPLMAAVVRKYLQKSYVRGWESIRFPHWPVDCTIERLQQRLLGFIIKAHGVSKIPFIWFWPDGFSAAAMMTHDVETAVGHDFCRTHMDINEVFGVRASFQFVPEGRYSISEGLIDEIRRRGLEVNVHDLNHDGRLFSNRKQFVDRAQRINHHTKALHAKGFRSGQLYREQDWYDALDVSYDMSVPNVGHLDPQRGGCCTVMPYFVGKVLELPLTTTQDYQYFNILDDYSIDLWERQTEMVLLNHGLVSFLIHPDYIIKDREQSTYRSLLAYLSRLAVERRIWMALPGEIDQWWRKRSQMRIVEKEGRWSIEGPGKEQAKLAYASLDGDRLVYTIE